MTESHKWSSSPVIKLACFEENKYRKDKWSIFILGRVFGRMDSKWTKALGTAIDYESCFAKQRP